MNVFLQSIYLQILLSLFIYWRGKALLPDRRCYRLPFKLFFVIELTIYFIGFFFHKSLPDDVMVSILYVCGTWYIASIYITMSLLVVELLRFICRKLGYKQVSNIGKLRLTTFYLIIIFVSGLMVKGYYDATHPIVKTIDITLPKRDSSRDSLKIVMMSDLHFGEMIGKKAAERFVALSNAQHPEMVVIVGDLLDYESRFAEREHIEEDLRQLQAPLGVYMVNGNHEYRANRMAKFRWIAKTGMTLLKDSLISPDSTFYLVGRDDYINKKREPLRGLMKDKKENLPVILLDHEPWTLSEATMNGVDLGLYGHTHDGQLWPYPLVMKLIYECSHGYYKKGPSQFFVSSGIGFAGPPYRIGTRSELIVLNIKFE